MSAGRPNLSVSVFDDAIQDEWSPVVSENMGREWNSQNDDGARAAALTSREMNDNVFHQELMSHTCAVLDFGDNNFKSSSNVINNKNENGMKEEKQNELDEPPTKKAKIMRSLSVPYDDDDSNIEANFNFSSTLTNFNNFNSFHNSSNLNSGINIEALQPKFGINASGSIAKLRKEGNNNNNNNNNNESASDESYSGNENIDIDSPNAKKGKRKKEKKDGRCKKYPKTLKARKNVSDHKNEIEKSKLECGNYHNGISNKNAFDDSNNDGSDIATKDENRLRLPKHGRAASGMNGDNGNSKSRSLNNNKFMKECLDDSQMKHAMTIAEATNDGNSGMRVNEGAAKSNRIKITPELEARLNMVHIEAQMRKKKEREMQKKKKKKSKKSKKNKIEKAKKKIGIKIGKLSNISETTKNRIIKAIKDELSVENVNEKDGIYFQMCKTALKNLNTLIKHDLVSNSDDVKWKVVIENIQYSILDCEKILKIVENSNNNGKNTSKYFPRICKSEVKKTDLEMKSKTRKNNNVEKKGGKRQIKRRLAASGISCHLEDENCNEMRDYMDLKESINKNFGVRLKDGKAAYSNENGSRMSKDWTHFIPSYDIIPGYEYAYECDHCGVSTNSRLKMEKHVFEMHQKLLKPLEIARYTRKSHDTNNSNNGKKGTTETSKKTRNVGGVSSDAMMNNGSVSMNGASEEKSKKKKNGKNKGNKKRKGKNSKDNNENRDKKEQRYYKTHDISKIDIKYDIPKVIKPPRQPRTMLTQSKHSKNKTKSKENENENDKSTPTASATASASDNDITSKRKKKEKKRKNNKSKKNDYDDDYDSIAIKAEKDDSNDNESSHSNKRFQSQFRIAMPSNVNGNVNNFASLPNVSNFSNFSNILNFPNMGNLGIGMNEPSNNGNSGNINVFNVNMANMVNFANIGDINNMNNGMNYFNKVNKVDNGLNDLKSNNNIDNLKSKNK